MDYNYNNKNKIDAITKLIEEGYTKEQILQLLKKDREKSNEEKTNKIPYCAKMIQENSTIDYSEVEENGVDKIIFKLKYMIDKMQYELILAKLDRMPRVKSTAEEVKNYLIKQIKENASKNGTYDYFIELKRKMDDMPFEFTPEGYNILSNRSNKITNTDINYRLQKSTQYKDSLVFIKPVEKKSEIEKQAKEKANYEILKMQKEQLWQERKKKVLEVALRTEEDRKLFIDGDFIVNNLRIIEQSEELEERVDSISDLVAFYMIQKYEENNKAFEKTTTPINQEVFIKYLNEKQKGISIDARKKIEEKENSIYDKIAQTKEGIDLETQEKASKQLENLIVFKQLLEFMKDSRYGNVSIFSKIKQIDFDELIWAVEDKESENQDNELIEFIKLQEKMISSLGQKTQITRQDYEENEDVRNLYKFLLYSKHREHTKSKTEPMVMSLFEQSKGDILKDNIEAIDLYNKYAKKQGQFTYDDLPYYDNER